VHAAALVRVRARAADHKYLSRILTFLEADG
jgi:hypothetical protein